MNKNFERPELDPSRMPVTEESKDDFLLFVDELTEKDLDVERDAGRYKEYKLDGERNLYLRVDIHSAGSPVHPDDESAVAIIDSMFEEGAKKFRRRTTWTLLRNRKFIKEDRLRKIDERLAQFIEFLAKPQKDWTETDRQRYREFLSKGHEEWQREKDSEKAAEELGLTTVSEAEAQEIIEILKQVKEQQKDRRT